MTVVTNFETRYEHQAVHMGHCIVVFGGIRDDWDSGTKYFSYLDIWMYNLFTEQWQKYICSNKMAPPKGQIRSCVVAIGTDIYLFGGKSTCISSWEPYNNELWKLTNTVEESFNWKEIAAHTKENTPSPRAFHSGWAYEGKLWFFGGEGPSPTGYLNPYNDDFHLFQGFSDYFENNQLLCFHPSEQRWCCVKQSGAVPSPRCSHAATVMEEKHKAWVYGGNSCQTDQYFYDLHALELSSFTWTLIATSPIRFQTRSLNVVGDTQLVLYEEPFVSD